MTLVQRMWQELVRTMSPLIRRALGRIPGSSGWGPRVVTDRADAKVISILPYLERRASSSARAVRPVQIIDLKRAPRPRPWRWPTRTPIGR